MIINLNATWYYSKSIYTKCIVISTIIIYALLSDLTTLQIIICLIKRYIVRIIFSFIRFCILLLMRSTSSFVLMNGRSSTLSNIWSQSVYSLCPSLSIVMFCAKFGLFKFLMHIIFIWWLRVSLTHGGSWVQRGGLLLEYSSNIKFEKYGWFGLCLVSKSSQFRPVISHIFSTIYQYSFTTQS